MARRARHGGRRALAAGVVLLAAALTAGCAPVADAGAGTASPSGQSIPPTPAGWRLFYRQDFTREAALGSFAEAYPGWASYDGITDTSRETARPRDQVGLWDSATTSSVHDGVFDCRLHTLGSRPQVCAVTPTPIGGRGQLYGRYVVRFRADDVPGYKIAWLLWPSSGDWRQGEVDFPEGALDGTITGSVHRTDGDPAQLSSFIDTRQRADRWRTATIEWVLGRITFTLDGVSWSTTDPRGLPSHRMRWALQAETEIRPAAPARRAEGHVQIDWLVAYSYRGGATVSAAG